MSPKKAAYLNLTIGKDCIIKDDVVIAIYLKIKLSSAIMP